MGLYCILCNVLANMFPIVIENQRVISKLALKFSKTKNKPILFKGQKNHLCDKCNASFTYLSTLNEHIQGASMQLLLFTWSIFVVRIFWGNLNSRRPILNSELFINIRQIFVK